MMNKFPIIKNISDVLPYIDTSNFIVADKGDYIVINYILPDKETFPDEISHKASIRLECRGIIFDKYTGKILRRPYQKFFNLGERENLSLENLSSYSKATIQEKLDGSMIAPFMVCDRIIWGTKMGETHITPKVEEWLNIDMERKLVYNNFAAYCNDVKLTPIFEWINPEDRIVLDYGHETKLVLVAVRDNYTGEYFDPNAMLLSELPDTIWHEVIPTVKKVTDKAFSEEFVNFAKSEEGVEGYVVTFDDGNKIKIKNDWYCQVHKAKSAITKERHIVDLMLSEKLDDLKPLLFKSDLALLSVFETNVHKELIRHTHSVLSNLSIIKGKNMSKKDFALLEAENYPAFMKAIIFKLFDYSLTNQEEYDTLIPVVLDMIKQFVSKNVNSNKKYSENIENCVLKDIARWTPIRLDDVVETEN